MEQNEAQYIKGFNRGYTITKYLPDLSESILKNIGTTNDFIEGFSSGKNEFEQEKSRTELDELSKIRSGSVDRNKELDRDV